jgi:hypothetical protein
MLGECNFELGWLLQYEGRGGGRRMSFDFNKLVIWKGQKRAVSVRPVACRQQCGQVAKMV